MACRNPNLQQMPRDPAYRACVLTPAGRVLVKCDYAAIEMRIAACTLAGRRRLGVERFREKANSPVQGAGADGLKLALGLLHETRDEVPSAAPILAVHDEIVLECDQRDAGRAREWLERCMREGMGELLKRVPVEVEGQIGFDWSMRAQPAEAAA